MSLGFLSFWHPAVRGFERYDLNIIAGVGMLTAIVLVLVLIILAARSKLVSTGNVTIGINEDPDKAVNTPAGDKLLNTPSGAGVVPAIRLWCVVLAFVRKILSGGGEMLPTERAHFTKREEKEGWRLSRQVAVKQDMEIEVEEELGALVVEQKLFLTKTLLPSSKS